MYFKRNDPAKRLFANYENNNYGYHSWSSKVSATYINNKSEVRFPKYIHISHIYVNKLGPNNEIFSEIM